MHSTHHPRHRHNLSLANSDLFCTHEAGKDFISIDSRRRHLAKSPLETKPTQEYKHQDTESSPLVASRLEFVPHSSNQPSYLSFDESYSHTFDDADTGSIGSIETDTATWLAQLKEPEEILPGGHLYTIQKMSQANRALPVDDFQSNLQRLTPKEITFRNVSRLASFLCSSWIQTVPAVTKILLVLLMVGALFGLLGAAKYTSFCPHVLATQYDMFVRQQARQELPVSAETSAFDVSMWMRSPLLLTLEASVPRVLFYPLISPSFGLAILLTFAVYYLGSSIEEHRGSVYLVHALSVIGVMTLMFFVTLYTALARFMPNLLGNSAEWVPASGKAGKNWFLFDALPTCASSYLCVSGAEPFVLALLYVELVTANRLKRYIMGLPFGISPDLFPWVLFGVFSLYWRSINLGALAGLLAGAFYAYFPFISLSPTTQHRLDRALGIYAPPPSEASSVLEANNAVDDFSTTESAENPKGTTTKINQSSTTEEFSRYAAINAMATSAGTLSSQVGPSAWYSLPSALIPLAMTTSPGAPYIDSVVRKEMAAMWKLTAGEPSGSEARERTTQITKAIGLSAELYAEAYPDSGCSRSQYIAGPSGKASNQAQGSSPAASSTSSNIVYISGIKLGSDLIEAHGVGALGAMLGGGRPFSRTTPSATLGQSSERVPNVPEYPQSTPTNVSVISPPSSNSVHWNTSRSPRASESLDVSKIREQQGLVGTNPSFDEELTQIASMLGIDTAELARRTADLVRFGYKERSALRALCLSKGDVDKAQEQLLELGAPTADSRVVAGVDAEPASTPAVVRAKPHSLLHNASQDLISDDEDD